MDSIATELNALEQRLDPAQPQYSGVEVVGYGEVSAVLCLPQFPDRVFKRMSGFPTSASADAYTGVVQRYMTILRDLEVDVAPTELIALSPATERHVVYIVQPRLDHARFGNTLLRQLPVHDLRGLLEQIFDAIRRVVDGNRRRDDEREVGIDAQLSNWHWPRHEARPMLIDISTPFMNHRGVLEVGTDVFLRAYPGVMQWWLRRTRAVEKYLEDYLDTRRTIVDLLGNFIKEGVADRVADAVVVANLWMTAQPDGECYRPIDVAEVRAYYARDAATLELSLRARRLTRFVQNELLGRRYDFILPGHIRR